MGSTIVLVVAGTFALHSSRRREIGDSVRVHFLHNFALMSLFVFTPIAIVRGIRWLQGVLVGLLMGFATTWLYNVSVGIIVFVLVAAAGGALGWYYP